MKNCAGRYLWTAFGLDPEPEYRFAPPRKWRFDYAWPLAKVAIEIEGGIWSGGRHVRGKGMLGDMAKYNAAAKLGWRVFRFTPQDLKNGIAQQFIKTVFDS